MTGLYATFQKFGVNTVVVVVVVVFLKGLYILFSKNLNSFHQIIPKMNCIYIHQNK